MSSDRAETASGSGKVSVVITTFNHAAFIADTLASVATQDYRNLEIIVADDGSTDETAAIIKRVAASDSRMVPILSPSNEGISRNVNRALDHVSGEYVAPLSGDDVMLPGKLAAQVDYLQGHPECGICTHDMEVFESTTGGTLYRLSDRVAPKVGGVEVLFPTNWMFGREMKSIPSSQMLRASVVARHRLDPRLRVWNEWLHEIEYTVESGLEWHYLPRVLGRYRVHATQTSRSAMGRRVGFEEMLIVLTIALVRYPELAPLVRRKRDFVLFSHLVYDWIDDGDRRAAYERLFRAEAGWMKWVYMKAAHFVLHHRWLLQAMGPARRAISRVIS